MPEEMKVVKGGFRATLALIISIVALIVAFIALDQASDRKDLDAQVIELKERVERMKDETSKRIDKVRQDTANTLERIGKAIKKEEKEEGAQ